MSAPPTDLELMMLADGELDAARRREVEAFLAAGDAADAPGSHEVAAARGKLDGLRAVSAVVASTGTWPERAGFDVVDGVFAALDRAPAATAPTPRRAASAPTRPANDNGRTIFGLALAAAAAAAGLFLWGRGGSDDSASQAQATRAPSAIVADQPSPSSLASGATDRDPRDPIAQAGAAVADARYGVEVASVDFGQRTGAIYYVPAASSLGAGDAAAAAVTTVVWLSDE